MRTNTLNLPSDKNLIIENLLNKIEREYKNDIAIVVCYGSYVTGTFHPGSDLDFFFIPVTPKGYEMSCQFVIDGIGYDFWPVSWERAKRIANFAEPIISIIADGVVVYYGEEEDLARFNSLKRRIEDLILQEKNKGFLLNKAEELLLKAKALYFDIYYLNGNQEIISIKCSKLLSLLNNAIAFINLTYVKKGIEDLKNQIQSYSYLPVGYVESVEAVAQQSNIKKTNNTIKKLIVDIEFLLQHRKATEEEKNIINDFKGFYEEIKSTYNKLKYACNTADYLKAYFIVNSISMEVRSLLGRQYDDIKFPDLLRPLYKKDYQLLKENARQHEMVLLDIFKSYNVNINVYDSVFNFARDLREN